MFLNNLSLLLLLSNIEFIILNIFKDYILSAEGLGGGFNIEGRSVS